MNRLFDPALIDDPYPHYARWREEAPIFRDADSGGWVLTRHDDVRAVLKDSTEYSSRAMGVGGPLPLLSDDPPRHTQLRGLVDRAFTARMLKKMEESIAAIADSLVAALPEDAPVDIVQKLTIPLPVAVIAQMMGIPTERGDDFKRWSDALAGTLSGEFSFERRGKDVMEMATFFQSLIPERRAQPRDDLVSAVVNAEIEGERLSDRDIVGFNMLLLIAGNETTTNLLGNFFNILAERPDLYAALVARPELVDAAIEETLRFDAPVQFVMREVTGAARFHGRDLAPGDHVHVVMASANRDPRAYDRADEFRLDREKNHHHTFGFGIHFCMGAPLARMEARIATRALLARFPRLSRGVGAIERVRSPILRGFHHLPIELSRAR